MRSAFTLVEILVVMAIIGLLTSILIVAIQPSIENARIAATKSVIMQIDGQLQRRLAAFNGLDLSQNVKLMVAHSNGTLNDQIATVIAKKSKYISAFPQRLEDLDGMLPGFGGSYYDADAPLHAVLMGINPSPNNTYMNSELLYLILTQGRALGDESYSIDGIQAQFIGDLDDDGLPEFLDAWGNPLRFYNAPTGLFRPDPSNPNNIDLTQGARIHFSSIPGDNGTASPPFGELYQDPFDKLGRVKYNSSGAFQWKENSANYNRSMKIEDYYHPNTYFSFLIVSAGPDGELGLYEPDNTSSPLLHLGQPLSLTNQDATFDNITNHQR